MTFKPPKRVLPSLSWRLLAVSFIFPLFAFAQNAPEKAVPEKAAVYAFGASDAGINKSLGGKLLSEFAQSGKYVEIADHYTFHEELVKSGNNSIGNITQAAKKHSADLVCAVNIVEVFGAYSITASIVKTSDSQVIKTASLDRSLKSLSDITAVSKELAAQLLGLPKTAEPPAAPWNIFKPTGYVPPPEPALQFQPPDSAAQQPATAAASPKPAPAMSIAQALGSTSLSKSCVEDFTNVLGKSGFSMGNWAKELVPSVAKTKLKLKSPFGKPQDGEMTSAGLSVGCIKSLPESPSEIQSLLKDIALKAGLSFVASAAVSAYGDDGEEEDGGDKSNVSFGIRVGINSSHLYAEYDYGFGVKGNGSYSSVPGLQAGTVLDITVSDWFHLQPGIMYIGKGTENGNETMILHYIEFPLLFSLKFSALRLNVGPYYGTCVSGDRSNFNNNDFGFSMGFGFDISKFYMGMFYDYGLTNISNVRNFEFYNRTLGFNIGVNL